MIMPGLEADEQFDPLMRMDKLEDVLNLKTIKTLKILVKNAILMIDSPNMITQIQISREDKPDEVEKMHNYNDTCKKIEEMEDDVAEFDVHKDLLSDALDVAGSPKEPIRFETGGSVAVISESNQSARLPKIRVDAKSSITLSMEAQTHLRKTLEHAPGDSVRVRIARYNDLPFCIFKNPRLTVMAGGMVKQT